MLLETGNKTLEKATIDLHDLRLPPLCKYNSKFFETSTMNYQVYGFISQKSGAFKQIASPSLR